MEINAYVFTGAPRAGKSYAVEELRRRGYSVFEEPIRKTVKALRLGKSSIPPFGLPATYPAEGYDLILDSCWKACQSDYSAAATLDLSFMDRGFPEMLHLYQMLHRDPPRELLKAAREWRYHQPVFFFEMLPDDLLQEKLAARPFYTVKDCHRIEKELTQIYTDLGYELVHVPFGEVNDRIAFVLNTIRLSAPTERTPPHG